MALLDSRWLLRPQRTRKLDNSNDSAIVVVVLVVVVFGSLLLVTKLPLLLSRLTDETPVLIVHSGSLEGGDSGTVALFSLAIVRIPFLLVTELSGM